MSRIQNPFSMGLGSTKPSRGNYIPVLAEASDLDKCYAKYSDDPKGHPEAFFANAMKVADIVSQLR